MMVVIIVGTLMYLVEGPENGFVSIPISLYWTIVTLTTVGYGDLTPLTGLGKVISSFVMILGYGIIAVPTGIVTAEFSRSRRETKIDNRICEHCSTRNHEEDANYCRNCGKGLRD
jgi:voltage-gated potassium channel